jgi:hypothetical protein
MVWPFVRFLTFLARVSAIPAKGVNMLQDGIISLVSNQSSSNYGSGVDGDLVLDGVVAAPAGMLKTGAAYRLVQDWCGGTLTVTGAGVALLTSTAEGSFRIYCKTKLKTAGGAYIDASGADAVLNVGGAATNDGTVQKSFGGPNGTNGNGTNGTAPVHGVAGNSGNGGTSLSAGGNGVSSAPPATAVFSRPESICGGPWLGAGFSPMAAPVALAGGASGASGGGGGTVNVGGGGGGGGGVLAIAARSIELESASDLRCRGGKGGDCTNSSNSGGGGGGTGGLALIVCQQLTVGAGVVDAATVCPGGAAGAGNGLQAPAATAGAVGKLYLIKTDVEYVPVASADDEVAGLMMLPDTFEEGAVPDPSTMPLRAVICITNGPDNQALYINRDGTKWSALG